MSYTVGSDAFLSAFNKDAELEALFSIDADLSAMLDFERCLATAQSDAGLILNDHEKSILTALQQFDPDLDSIQESFAQDGVSPPSLIKQIRGSLQADVQQYFHFGATSQDLIDTSLMIRLKRCVSILENRVVTLDDKLASITQDQSDERVLQARTRMQNALPISIPEKIAGWRAQLSDLLNSKPEVFPLQLGGPEGAARKFAGAYQEVVTAMASELKLDAPNHHWQTNRQPVTTIAFWCCQVASVVGKLATDILIMVQTDVGEVGLSGGGSSSAMAHKKNPVLAEIVVAQSRYCQIQMNGLNFASIHENERSGSAWTLEWMLLPPLVIMTGCTAVHMSKIIDGLTFK